MNLYFITLILIVIISMLWLTWWYKKNLEKVSTKIEEEFDNNSKNLNTISENIIDTNELLKTYKKVIEEKTAEINQYKNGADISRQKGLFLSLIDLLNFVKTFNTNSQLNDQIKNYLIAIEDKINILLQNSGVEEYFPPINKNIMYEKGCSAGFNTTKTNDPNQENCISKIVKPGYCIKLKEDSIIFLKDAEVEIFELKKND